MKKTVAFLGLLALALAVSLSSVNAGVNPKGKPFIALNDQIIEVKGTVSSLQDQIDLLVGEVDSIEQRIVATENAIQTVYQITQDLQFLIDSNLTQSIADIQGEIDYLNAENATLESMIEQNSGDIQLLQAEVDANDTLIARLVNVVNQVQSGVIALGDSLQNQINNNADLIAILEEQIALLNAALVEKQALITGSCPDGFAIVKVNTDGSVVCGEAGGSGGGAIESNRVFTGAVASPGFTVEIGVSCDDLGDGWFVSSSGMNNAHGWDVKQLNTTPLFHPLYPNGAVLTATNVNSPVGFISVIATCLRFVQ